MNWFPLLNYTHYSLQRGFSRPTELVAECKKRGYSACGISDYKSISGAVSFYSACKDHGIIPIIGCGFDGFSLFANNKNGWNELIKLVSSIQDGEVDPKILSKAAKSGNLFKVKSGQDFPESYYVYKQDAELHRILLCSGLKCTIKKAKSLVKGTTLQKFFEEDEYYLKEHSSESSYFQNVIKNYEEYNILSQPILPQFETPNGESEEEYLTKLARKGWAEKCQKNITTEEDRKIYGDRFRKEFDVIKEAKLSGYFLIVQDIIQYAKDQGWMVGPGRGSAAGCLISYLVGITEVDPIEFDLLFERFYNSGRNTKDNISLPDIDIDIPGKKRDQIISYIKDKYGHANVSQMVTFGRLQGRSAIKEVLRVNEVCNFSVMNEITKYIPDEAAISDQLAEMDDEDRSIIRWALQNNSKELYDYCHLNDEEELEGDYAEYFDQAIKIEGTLKTQGKHAAGVVISANELSKVCPMVSSKSGVEKIAGLEMADLEALGHVKFDVLAINLLDKLMYIEKLVKENNE
jgi:DNA polymerase-3 subunit alpha